MEPKTTGKRIVSKQEYVQRQAQRATNNLLGGCAMSAARLCGLFAIVGCFGFLVCLLSGKSAGMAFCLLGSPLAGGGAYLLYKAGLFFMKNADQLDPSIPLTRANTAHLPAPDSLVRASQEPAQAQEAVLLRAAAQSVEKHEEQLVRAVNGQE